MVKCPTWGQTCLCYNLREHQAIPTTIQYALLINTTVPFKKKMGDVTQLKSIFMVDGTTLPDGLPSYKLGGGQSLEQCFLN